MARACPGQNRVVLLPAGPCQMPDLAGLEVVVAKFFDDCFLISQIGFPAPCHNRRV